MINKRIFWMFRTNLINLEYYHEFKDLETFENNCHDFYLLMPLFFIKNNDFDEVIIWRMYPEKKDDIIFNIGEKQFIQRWVKDFNEVFEYEKPDVSFFRGGFQIYCDITKKDPDFFGLKLYLGSSKRVIPKFGGIYDKILVEDDFDIFQYKGSIPFFKTANEKIFRPLNSNLAFNICWIANFTQLKHKGQEYFINKVADSAYLSQQKIIHVGNRPEIGKDLCNKYNVRNILFLNYRTRSEINDILNISKCGIVTSNLEDGCPRILTEIMMSGTPLLKRRQTRMLDFYYRNGSVLIFNDEFLEETVKYLNENYDKYKKMAVETIDNFTLDKICKKNLELWQEK